MSTWVKRGFRTCILVMDKAGQLQGGIFCFVSVWVCEWGGGGVFTCHPTIFILYAKRVPLNSFNHDRCTASFVMSFGTPKSKYYVDICFYGDYMTSIKDI